MKAYTKDVVRSISHSKKRYLSIVIICALGATMLTGLAMACLDLREAAEELYEQQNLFDISVQSTFGLTDNDIGELSQIDGVTTAEGGYEIETYTMVDGSRSTVMLKTLLDSGMNEPYLVDGKLPETANEVAVTENYLDESGKSIGDTVTIEDAVSDDPTGLSDLDTSVSIDDDDADDADDAAYGSTTDSESANDDESADEDPLIEGGTYTIVGTIIDPANIMQPEGPIAFRASSSSDYTFFLSRDAVTDPDTYTVAYLSVAGTEGLATYSDEYQDIIDEVQDRVEDLAPQREAARTEQIKADALDEIDDAEADANEQLADAEEELDDAQATINESLEEVLEGQRELDTQRIEAIAELDDAQALIDANGATLVSGAASLAEGQKELSANVQAFNEALPAAEQQLRDGQTQLDAAREEVDAEIAQLKAQVTHLQDQADDSSANLQSLNTEVAGLVSALKQLGNSLDQADDPPIASADVYAAAAAIEKAWSTVGSVDATDSSASASAVTTFVTSIAHAQQTLGDAIANAEAGDAAQDDQTGTPALTQASATIQLDDSEETLSDAVGQDAPDAASGTDAQGDSTTGSSTQSDADTLIEQDPTDERDTADEEDAIDEQDSGTNQSATTNQDAAADQDQTTGTTQSEESDTTQDGTTDAGSDQSETTSALLSQMKSAYQELSAALATENDSIHAANLATQRIQVDAELAGTQTAVAQLNAAITQMNAAAQKEFATQQAIIDAGWDTFWNGYEQLVAAQTTLDATSSQINSGFAQLAAAQEELDAQQASALAQLAEAQEELDDGLEELAEAQAELDDGRATFEEERDDALQQIANARNEVNDIDEATWYITNATQVSSVSSVDSDASSIETIAKVIPVIFFIVAILVSLTTATRMVEEERGLIGIYKALGYSNNRILAKYLIYAASAAFIGGVIGDIIGFVVIPNVLYTIFQAMYLLPLFSLHFNTFYAVFGIAAFVIGIAGSTFITCRNDLRESPASLMRPRAPRAGSRIFLEHIKPLWRHMKFLNKVTARNLFRYKKRLAMTIFGILGCTALLICGFSLKNTVETLAPRQYDQIFKYDLMAVSTADDYEDARTELEDSGEITDLQPIGVDTITVDADGDSESMQLYVIPDGGSIDDYVTLETLDEDTIDLDEADVVITNNAATVLGVDAGDTVQIATSTLDEADVTIGAVTRNYLSNAVYMTENAYEGFFGEFELNGFYAHLTGDNDEQKTFAEDLESDEYFVTISSVAELEDQFEESFTLINVVVYVIIALAAGLAFVVLFTLSTVNIGEREREIATIKVLGFRKGEVRTYINKETFVLTALGILAGLPAGWALSESFTYILNMPSIYFDVIVAPWCYALAAVLSVAFALIVTLVTNRMLSRIDMVEALRSPE